MADTSLFIARPPWTPCCRWSADLIVADDKIAVLPPKPKGPANISYNASDLLLLKFYMAEKKQFPRGM